MSVKTIGFIACTFTAVGALAFGCGGDDSTASSGAGGSSTSAATTSASTGGPGPGSTTATTATTGTTSSTAAASTGAGGGMGGAGGGGAFTCDPEPNDDACNTCIKTMCCDQAKACFADPECATCANCLQTAADPMSCITDGTCSFAGTTGTFLQCAAGCQTQCQ